MRVSVILPVFNAEKYVSEAVNSILNQTYTDFELVAIDDGSTDNSLNILKSFDDPRVIIIQNDGNLGLIKTLNKGIELAKGEYLARMDADDISMPKRFEKQVKLLDGNPDIGVCSTWIDFFGDDNETIRFPVDHKEIFFRFLLGVQVGHANSVIRRDLLKNLNIRYDSNFLHSEDTNLWVSLLPYTRFTNIPEVLYRYRKYKEQVTQVYTKEVNDSFHRAINIHFRNILKLFSISCDDTFELFPTTKTDKTYLDRFEFISQEMILQNSLQKCFNDSLVKSVILQLWKDKLRKCDISNYDSFRRVFLSDFANHIGFPMLKRVKFFINSL
jgi:glycosyltransferase involved in cell wall biosynthesis